MAVYIGTSGWSYDHWQGILYPENTPVRDRLPHYLGHGYRTVEVNATYYRWPVDATFAGWRTRTPDGFQMTVKAPRGLTHSKKLLEPEAWLARIENGLRKIGDRLGVFLVQLPPQMGYDYARLAYFLGRVPPGIRVAMEFRHPSWNRDDVWALLERHDAAYCVMSGAHLPCILKVTASFAYVRLHGPDENHMYAGSYADADLRWWADRIHEWHENGRRSVYVYFNNDGGGNAVRNADTLRSFVGE